MNYFTLLFLSPLFFLLLVIACYTSGKFLYVRIKSMYIYFPNTDKNDLRAILVILILLLIELRFIYDIEISTDISLQIAFIISSYFSTTFLIFLFDKYIGRNNVICTNFAVIVEGVFQVAIFMTTANIGNTNIFIRFLMNSGYLFIPAWVLYKIGKISSENSKQQKGKGK